MASVGRWSKDVVVVGKWSENQGTNRTFFLLRDGDVLGYRVKRREDRAILFETRVHNPSPIALNKAAHDPHLTSRCRPIFNDDHSVLFIEKLQVVHRLGVGYLKNLELFRTDQSICYRIYDRPDGRLIQSGILPDLYENTAQCTARFFRDRWMRKEKIKSLEKTLELLVNGKKFEDGRKFTYVVRFEKRDCEEEARFCLTFYPCPEASTWPEANDWGEQRGIPDLIPTDADQPIGKIHHCSILLATKTAHIYQVVEFFSQTHRGFEGISDQGQIVPGPLFFQNAQLPEAEWKTQLLGTELVATSTGSLRIQQATSHFDVSVSISTERWAMTVAKTSRKESGNPVSWGGHAVLFIERMQQLATEEEPEPYFLHDVKQIDLQHLPEDTDERVTIRYASFDPGRNPHQLAQLINRAWTQQISRRKGEMITVSVLDDQEAQRNDPPRFYYRLEGSIGFLRKFVALPITGGIVLIMLAGVAPAMIAITWALRIRILVDIGDCETIENNIIDPICGERLNSDERLRNLFCLPVFGELFGAYFWKATNAVWPWGTKHNCISWIRTKLAIANVTIPTHMIDTFCECPI